MFFLCVFAFHFFVFAFQWFSLMSSFLPKPWIFAPYDAGGGIGLCDGPLGGWRWPSGSKKMPTPRAGTRGGGRVT